MRAKEYLYNHTDQLKHSDILKGLLNDLLPLRSNKEATDTYVYEHLFADKNDVQYKLQKNLFEQGCAVQPKEPRQVHYDEEIDMNLASEIRGDLLTVIQGDASFGYLFYILGRDYNTNHVSTHINCVPNPQIIVSAIKENMDDYPKNDLDSYLNEDFNFEQYQELMDNDYPNDNDTLLRFFNTSYHIYDEIRLRKQSFTNVKKYIEELQFSNNTEQYWIMNFILKMLDKSKEKDPTLERIHSEVKRIMKKNESNLAQKACPHRESSVHLRQERGARIDIIRVLNVLYEMGYFESSNGCNLSKKEFMQTMGEAMNIDLTNYDKDLSRALSDSTTLDKHLKIFERMTDKMTEIFNIH